MEQLEASGGVKATDALELFAPPGSTSAGQLVRCFVRGIRYKERAEESIASLPDQAKLRLSWEPRNRHAVCVLDTMGNQLGYLPNYLTKELYANRLQSDFSELLSQLEVTVERINEAQSPLQQRLKVQVPVPRCTLKGGLFEGDAFQPFSKETPPYPGGEVNPG